MDVLFLHRGQQFVWDAAKAATNVSKHGIRFEAACDPFVQEAAASVEDEVRDAAIGIGEDWKLLYVVHLIREDDWIRIISARPATAKEKRAYEDGH